MRDLYLNVGLSAPKLSPVTPTTATPYARLTNLLGLLRAADVVSVDVRWGAEPVVAVHMRIFDTVSPGGWVSFLAGWVGQDAIAWEAAGDRTTPYCGGLSGIGAHGMKWDDSKFWRPWEARRDAYRFERVQEPLPSTANPIRTEPVYGKPRTELPPAPRVVNVDGRYRIQHPVHGKWLRMLFRGSPMLAYWHDRDTAEYAAAQLPREGVLDDPTWWVAL
jgi:hypothetical protein